MTGSRPLGHRINYWIQLAVRFALAFAFLEYGVAKLLGTQFIRSGSSLDRRVSDLSGFELTWIYFGYSSLLSGVIAWGQIACGALLLFDRTKRIGMFGLFPITVNIVLVNFGYNISHDTQVLSCVFLAMNAYLILSEFPALKRFLWDQAVEDAHRPAMVERFRPIAVAVRVLFLAGAVGVGYSTISHLKSEYMSETVLSGDWTVERVLFDGKPAAASEFPVADWEKICFEQAGHASIRVPDGGHGGRYEIGDGQTIRLRYSPRVQGGKLTDEERQQAEEFMRKMESMPIEEVIRLSEAEMEKSLTAEVKGRYELAPDGTKLVVRGEHAGRTFEIVLVPWVWEKR